MRRQKKQLTETEPPSFNYGEYQLKRKELVENREAIYLAKFMNICHFNIAIGVSNTLDESEHSAYISELASLRQDLNFINAELQNDCNNISSIIRIIDEDILKIKTLINC